MPGKSREISQYYSDPVELIWTRLAGLAGMQIQRDDEVFAAWDGKAILRIGTDSLDADDSIAQMVLHELCHFFVEGPESMQLADWGLNEGKTKDRTHEFAALRLQAFLSGTVGMKSFFSATTDFREYYDRLSGDFLEEKVDLNHPFEIIRPVTLDEDQAAIRLAKNAYADLEQSEVRQHINETLEVTRQIQLLVSPWLESNSLWSDG